MKRLSKEINNIKALVIEDFGTGEIKTYYNKYEFEELLSKYTENEVTKVFEMTPDIKNKILKVISENVQGEDNKIKIDIDGIEIFTKIFPIITDMDFDMDLKEDYDYLFDLVTNPTEWMDEVLKVVIPRVQNLAKLIIESANKFNKLSKKEQGKVINELKNIDTKTNKN